MFDEIPNFIAVMEFLQIANGKRVHGATEKGRVVTIRTQNHLAVARSL